MPPNVLGYAQAVHSRHAAVQKHQPVGVMILVRAFNLDNRLMAISCFLNLRSPRGQSLPQDHSVGWVIVHNQGFQALEIHYNSAGRALRLASSGEIERETERTPLPWFALYGQVASHQADQPFGNGEPQTGAAVGSCSAGIGLR